MSQYRFHLDVPLGTDQAVAIQAAKFLVAQLEACVKNNSLSLGTECQYRLGFDTDRQRSNYLDIDEQGHCSNKKMTL